MAQHGNKRKGRHRKGGLYRDKNGVWRFRIQINGKRVTRTTGTKDKRKAQSKQREIMEYFARRENEDLLADVRHHLERSAETASGNPMDGRIAIEEAWQHYPYDYTQRGTRHKLDDATITDNKYHWDVFRKWAVKRGLTYLDEVTEEHARQFDKHLDKGRSGNRINKIITTCRVVFRLAGIRPNPFKNVTRRGHVSKHRKPLTMEQVRSLVDTAEGEMRLLLVQGMYTGGRLGAIINRKWGDHVDPDLAYVRSVESKTQKHHDTELRYIIHPYLRNELAQVPYEQRKGYVLPGLAKMYNTRRQAISQKMRRLLEKCEIEAYDGSSAGRKTPVIGFHSLRHTVATWMAENGVPQAVAEAMLGHNNTYIHRIYVHVGAKAVNNAVSSLPSLKKSDNEDRPQDLQQAILELLRDQADDNWREKRDQAIDLLTGAGSFSF